MKEQSHKEEMASALRGDFARLRSRGVATTLSPPAETTAPPGELDAPASALQPLPPEPVAPEQPWITRFLGIR